MRKELNGLIRSIVNTRFAVEDVALEAIQTLRKGYPITYRGHEWQQQHFEVMERVHQGVEAAWHYAKWLQFPEMQSRLEDGFEALSQVLEVEEIISTSRLTEFGFSIASPAAIGWSGGDDGKETVMARTTVAELEKVVEELQEQLDQHVENLNEQIAELEQRLDEVEESGDRRKSRGRQMTAEQRREVGIRLQQGRADKLGLETIQQLRELHLKPGEKPTKKEIAAVKKQFPADDFDLDAYLDEQDSE